MKLKLFLFSTLLLITNSLFAQDYIIKVKQFSSSKYSYINEKAEALSNKQYHYASDFSSDGVALVQDENLSKFYIIDKNEEVIEMDFPFKPIDMKFTGGMIRIEYGTKKGAINTKGELIVPRIYDKLTEFNGNHAFGKIGNIHYIVKSNGEQIELKSTAIEGFKRFSDGLAPIKIDLAWGCIDTLGNMAIPCKFKSIGYYNGGRAWAKNFKRKVGIIDKSGHWLVHPEYKLLNNYDPESGMTRAYRKKIWGYVDSIGTFHGIKFADTYYNFHEGLVVKHSNSKAGYYNTNAEWEIEPIYSQACEFINGYAKVEYDDLWGIINKKGNWVIRPQFKEIGKFVEIKK